MIVDNKELRVKWYEPKKHAKGLVNLHKDCFPNEQWKKNDFAAFVNKQGKNNVLKVLEDEAGAVCGSLLYTLTKESCIIRRVAVEASLRRRGLGTYMIHGLVGPRSPIRRRTFIARVRDSNYPAQAMFHSKFKFAFDPKAPRQKLGEEDTYVFTLQKAVPEEVEVCEGR